VVFVDFWAVFEVAFLDVAFVLFAGFTVLADFAFFEVLSCFQNAAFDSLLWCCWSDAAVFVFGLVLLLLWPLA
jgi:hypothetical protein